MSFVNDLRSSYSCRFVFCGLWRSSLARVELEQYYSVPCSLCTCVGWKWIIRLFWCTCCKGQCIIQLSDSSRITKVLWGRCNGLLSKVFICSSSNGLHEDDFSIVDKFADMNYVSIHGTIWMRRLCCVASSFQESQSHWMCGKIIFLLLVLHLIYMFSRFMFKANYLLWSLQ